jgi:alpha-1,2-mannosyltransferase
LKALVLHTSLSGLGGAEKVSLAIIESLKNMGFHVKLFTMEPTNWSSLTRVFHINKKMLPDEYMSLLKFRIRKFTIYTRLIMSKIMELKSKGKYDLIINSHGDALPIASDIVYMHFPGFAAEEFYPYERKGFKGNIYKLYLAGYNVLKHFMLPNYTNSKILCNSTFSKAIIRLKIGIDAEILYPPIDTKFFSKAFYLRTGNEPYHVISIGRFSPEKNYEAIIEIARKAKDLVFYIVGSIGGAKEEKYFRKLLTLRSKYKLENLFLLPNIKQSKLLYLMSKSRVLLHTMKYEHFGMAVAEGMVAGLVPVVHRSGGVYYDIIEKGAYGFYYKDLDEALEVLSVAIREYPRLYQKLHLYAVNKFGKQQFIKKFMNIVKSLKS